MRAHGAPPTEEDVNRLFAQFTPILIEVLERHCDLIPGVLEVTHELRERGIRFANTTGFDSYMIEGLKKKAEEAGYKPDLWITPDLVGGPGRPAPWMAFHAARAFDIYPMSAFVKIGDTLADIEEAHAAGMWAVAVVRHGNEVGLSRETIEALHYREWQQISDKARARLATKKPHYIIDSTAGALVVIDQINARLARGERP
jgi:phosphonoacetaldehyde hydrolase